MRRFLVILVVLVIIAAGVFEWATAAWNAPGLPAREGGETVILIAPHTRAHDVAQVLEEKGAIKSGLMFELDLRLKGLANQIKAGEYAIPSHASLAQIAEILIAGKSIQRKLTAAEGLTSDMIWKLVQADPVLVGAAGPVPAEGTLLPETYLFTRGETRANMLAKMARAQGAFLAAHWASRSPGLPFPSMKEAVILASIVEKETALPEERRHIASVFLNRLRIGMALQTDPTIIYGLTRGYPLGHGIRQSELQSDTPYNTYRITGLPPGPICNPGKDSIAAVLDPEKTDDLYFVANGKGGHVFSATIADHARNVAALRNMERQANHEVQESGRVGAPEIGVPDAALPALPAHKAKRRAHR
ncbi:MAG TPA: endolytic transglycosylase MltG [Rhizomicrobium sp.]|nr:endolytic transglycosylase MltG [Rhizomicrobium sp.]